MGFARSALMGVVKAAKVANKGLAVSAAFMAFLLMVVCKMPHGPSLVIRVRTGRETAVCITKGTRFWRWKAGGRYRDEIATHEIVTGGAEEKPPRLHPARLAVGVPIRALVTKMSSPCRVAVRPAV